MAEQQDMSALLRHFEDELEGISALCTTNSSEDAEEALSQAEALLSHVVAFAGLFVSDESDGDALVQAVISVVQAIQSHLDTLQRSVARHRGRPQIHVSEEQLVMLLDLYFTVRDIASMLQVSRDTVRRRMRQYELQGVAGYSSLTDGDLDNITRQYVEVHPNCGSRSYAGYLRSQGMKVQRFRARDSLFRVDPEAVASRLRQALHRRRYNVCMPNSLWHIDGYH